MRARLAALLDRILGAPCDRCRERVYDRDRESHERVQHAGDRPWAP